MAYRKVDEASLTAVADSIREKGGTTGALAFPDGFVSAVQAIQAGGGEADSSFKDVIERTAVNPTLPSDLTKIGNYAFDSCTNLALTSLPDGVNSIGNYAFERCTNLALTSLPYGVTSISGSAFQRCSGLTTITFEGTPSSISSRAFYDCIHLTTINVPWSEGAVANAPWGATNATINYNYTGE